MNQEENAVATGTPATEEVPAKKHNPFAVAEEAAKAREVVKISEIKRKTIRPRKQWVLIRKTTKVDKLTDSGLVIAEGNVQSQLGEIVAVAPGTDLTPGDLVLFTNFAMTLEDVQEVTQDNKLFLVREEEVYGVVEDLAEEVT